MDPYKAIIEPIVTEKAFGARGERRYVFRVHPDATKIDIKAAINVLFKVKPIDVNTICVKGKRRMMGYKVGKTRSYKKAYVTLSKDQKIEELEV